MDKDDKCFHHEDNEELRKSKGFITGGCVIRWDIPCGGTPNKVLGHHKCPGFYVPMKNIKKLK